MKYLMFGLFSFHGNHIALIVYSNLYLNLISASLLSIFNAISFYIICVKYLQIKMASINKSKHTIYNEKNPTLLRKTSTLKNTNKDDVNISETSAKSSYNKNLQHKRMLENKSINLLSKKQISLDKTNEDKSNLKFKDLNANTAPKLKREQLKMTQFSTNLKTKTTLNKPIITQTTLKNKETKSTMISNIRTNVTINSPRSKKFLKIKTTNEDVKNKSINNRNTDDSKRSQTDLNLKFDNHKRNNTITLKPEEIKVLSSLNNKDDIKNLALPKAYFIPLDEKKTLNKSDDSKIESLTPESNSISYEDDFESYESDFDSYESSNSSSIKSNLSENRNETSSGDESLEKSTHSTKIKTEEEKKFDSGNYELGDILKMNDKLEKTLEEIKEIDNYNIEESNKIHQHYASLTDEGFDENSTTCSPSIQIKVCSNVNKTLINTYIQRAKDLKSMLVLDNVKYTLFEFFPMNYESFISIYGKSNCNQTYVQTNEDDVSISVQTEQNDDNDVWTQYPVAYSKYLFSSYKSLNQRSQNRNSCYIVNPLEAYINQRSCCSLNKFISQNDIEKKILDVQNYNVSNLSKFIQKTGGFVLEYLNEQLHKNIDNSVTNESKKNILITNESMYNLIKDISIKKIYVPEYNNNILLTLHLNYYNMINNENFRFKSIICVWSFNRKIFEPQKLLITPDEISCLTIIDGLSGLVIAGLNNGNICMWDLQEENILHDYISSDNNTTNDKKNIFLRKCSFNSSNDDYKTDFWGSIVDLIHIKSYKNNTQIYALQEYGLLTIWMITNKIKNFIKYINELDFRSNSSYWSRVTLTKITVIDLNKSVYNNNINNFEITTGKTKSSVNNDKKFNYHGSDQGYNLDSVYHKINFEINSIKKNYNNLIMTDLNYNNKIICKSLTLFEHTNKLMIVYDGIYILNYSLNGFKTHPFIFTCEDEGSTINGIEINSSNSSYFFTMCGDTIHLFTLNNSKPIKNFIYNDYISTSSSYLRSPPLKRISLKSRFIGALHWSSENNGKWYSKKKIYNIKANPFIFITLHGNNNIILWDLSYSDIFPKLLIMGMWENQHLITDKVVKNEIINLIIIESNYQNNELILVLHFATNEIQFYIIHDKDISNFSQNNKTKELLHTYLQYL